MEAMILFRARPYAGQADLQAVCDLLNACDAADKLDDNYDLDSLELELTSPEIDQARDMRVWEGEAGELIGFGQTWIPPTLQSEALSAHLYFRVHPQARDRTLEDDIIAWGRERIRQAGAERGLPANIQSGVREHFVYGRKILEERGFTPVRYFFRMGRDLGQPIPEPQFPEGYTLRHMRPGSKEDLEKWVECYNQSFIDHWNHHLATTESHKHWLAGPTYRPDLDLVAVAPDDSFAAFCHCAIDPGQNERNGRSEGWIHLLGTRRGHRKIGLGKAMLLAGLQALKEGGVKCAVLGVDAENPTGALGLYEGTGFYKVHTSIVYERET